MGLVVGVGVWGSGFGSSRYGGEVWGSKYFLTRVKSWSMGLGVWKFTVWGFGLWGSEFEAPSFRYVVGVSGVGCQVWSVGFISVRGLS